MRRGTLIALALAAAVPAPAAATVRYAAPGPSQSVNCTSELHPCRLDKAVSAAVTNPGDEIIVLPGTHEMGSSPATIGERLTVHGKAGAEIPLIRSTDDGVPLTVDAGADGTRLFNLSIRSFGDSADSRALQVNADNVFVEGVTLAGVRGCVRGAGATGQQYNLVKARLLSAGQHPCLDVAAVTLARLRDVDVSAPSPTSGHPVLVDLGPGTSAARMTVSAGGSEIALRAASGSTVRRLVARGGDGFVGVGEVLLTDSLVLSSAADGTAVGAIGSSGDGLDLRNVDAIATGSSSVGVEAGAGLAFLSPGRIDARNVIARGTAADLRSQFGPDVCNTCDSGSVYVEHSSFRTFPPGGNRGWGQGNQSGDPRFLGPSDFRVAADSPVIDAGTVNLLGDADLDGAPRMQGAAVDIGAYERAKPPAQPQDPGPPVPGTVPPAVPGTVPPAVPGTVPGTDTVAPRLSKVRLIRRGGMWRLWVRSSEAASLRAGIVRGKHRRPQKTLTAKLRTGLNRVTLRPGKLAKGRYRLLLTASDAARNRSLTKTIRFRIRSARR